MKAALAPGADRRTRPTSRAPHALLLLAAAVLLFLWCRASSFASPLSAAASTATTTAMTDTSSSSSSASLAQSLEVAVRQTDARTLTLAVTNRAPATTLTVLTWDTPLDPLAPKLALLKFVPAGAGEPLPSDGLQVRRKMPPDADALATLAPGQTLEAAYELREPFAPLDQLAGKKAAVLCQGRWPGVWDAAKFQMGDLEDLDAAPHGTFDVKLEDAEF